MRPILFVMELAIKLCFAALCIIHIVDIIDAVEICKVPRGNAGTCMKITNCPPLRNLYKKKHKTINENKFIRQSVCGYPDYDPIKVCCPSQSKWDNFRPDPVIVPPSNDSGTPNVTENPILSNPNNSKLQNEVYPRSSGNEITNQSRCTTTNREEGTCIPLVNCQPLFEIVKKQNKTREELLFLKQSKCLNVKYPIKVCCPSQSKWDNFRPDPVIVPPSNDSGTPNVTENPILSNPNNSKLQNEVYPRSSGNEITNQSRCTTTNREEGTCIPLVNCQPLFEIVKKQNKTREELLFLKQSKCLNVKYPIKVCCPSQSKWDNFRPDPVIVPPSNDSGTPNVTENPILSNPNNSKLQNEVYPRSSGNEITNQSRCTTTNREEGTCIPLVNCQPLFEIVKKQNKTREELLFLKQSKCLNVKYPIKVCCPSQSKWHNFRPDPVIVPPSNDSGTPNVTENPILSNPNNSKLQNEVYPRSSGNEITNARCTNPNGEEGICIPLLDCQSLLNLVQKEERTTEELLLLRQSKCGFVNDTLKICCPLQNTSTPDNTDYTKICGFDTSNGNRITNGNVTAIDQYPWLVLLEYKNSVLGCGGSLISSRFVLTAGHCIKSSRGQPLFVRLGEYNTTSYPTDVVETDGGGIEKINVTIIAIKEFYVYPFFNRARKINDIGLIEMESPVEFGDFIKVICVPQKDYIREFNISTFFYVAGWGSDNQSSGTDVKMDTTVPYKTHRECPLVSQELPTTPALQICAGGEGGRDTCRGDSGGPLMFETENNQYAVVGIVSYGDEICGKEDSPAVYTYVYGYISWIKSILDGKPNI